MVLTINSGNKTCQRAAFLTPPLGNRLENSMKS
jgi:hypothetical protein